MKLWEYDHPYYCNEGNFYKNELLFMCDSWDEFMSDMGDADEDMNFLWRFDWKFDEEENKPYDYISLFYIMQRKGYNCSWEVKVKQSDHDKIKEFLLSKSKRVVDIWQPLIDAR